MSGRWLLPAGDTGKVTYAVHRQESGPLTEIDFGPGAPILQFRDLAGLDELVGAAVAARAEHGQEQARHAARPLVPPERDAEPAWAAPAIEPPLIDPDCAAGKCNSCVGGPCQHHLYEGESDEPSPAHLPHRAPLMAPDGEPMCDEEDGNWACTASPLHPGDHASHHADGTPAHQWEREPV